MQAFPLLKSLVLYTSIKILSHQHEVCVSLLAAMESRKTHDIPDCGFPCVRQPVFPVRQRVLRLLSQGVVKWIRYQLHRVGMTLISTLS